MKILAVIAARGGSKGVKNKNIRPLLGKPLIACSIEQLKRWGKFEKFIVSTDSQEIASVAKEYGAEVPFMRPQELATDKSNKMDALRHAYVEAEKYYGVKFDALLDLDVTAPIRTVEDIENIVNLFKEKKADCVFSVVKAHRNPYFNMVEEQKDGSVKVCKSLVRDITRRQDVPLVYDMNASLYVYSREFLLNPDNKTPYSGKCYVYKMKDESATDIDREVDFKLIELLVREEIVRI
ncbi:MAG: acylneuraminate cytidylyltransferase family protein [Candidatus Omnitrophota bacterium]